MSQVLAQQLHQQLADQLLSCKCAYNEVTIELAREQLLTVCQCLRDHQAFQFNQLMDVCGIDYLDYGVPQWQTESTTATGFERGVMSTQMMRNKVDNFQQHQHDRQVRTSRFAVGYHLLSTTLNQRLRVRVFVNEADMMIDSVRDIWLSADWFEREAFDLFGILFKGHPDLRRILTDYGFVGHPFRKDFPLSGNVEVRYDAQKKRVFYEPVDIEPRVLVPKVIRYDNRYQSGDE